MWPVASRIYLEVTFSTKIQIQLPNSVKAMSGDLTIRLEVLCIDKVWNPMEVLGRHHSYIDFPGYP